MPDAQSLAAGSWVLRTLCCVIILSMQSAPAYTHTNKWSWQGFAAHACQSLHHDLQRIQVKGHGTSEAMHQSA